MGKQYSFSSANVYGISSDNAPIELMSMQDITLDFSRDTKELTGRKAFPEIIALGKGKASGKGTIATYNANAINTLLNGMGTITSGQRLHVQEAFTLAAGTNTYTVANAENFYKNLGVKNAATSTNVVPLDYTTGTPSVGEYAVTSGGVYTLSAADCLSGFTGIASYLYEKTAVAGARTFTVTTNFVADDTITVGGVTLTATSATTSSTKFAVGSTITETVANIVTALNANSTVTGVYTVSTSDATFTLTETTAGGGYTPSAATVTGTGVVSSGTATTSTTAGGQIITLDNPDMAVATFFSMFIQGTLINKQNAAKQVNVWLNCCLSSKLGFGWKVEDFNNPSFEFSATSDDLDSLGWMSVGQ